MILPYLFGDFHPSHIQEYAGGLLFAFEKPAKDCSSMYMYNNNGSYDDDVFYLFLQRQKSAQNYIPQGYFPPY
jgi:hypothetical protein